MALRNFRLKVKNSDVVNRPLPGSLYQGEPIVNLAEGIMYFSGVTTSTEEWTPAGTGSTGNFFEVGSNLYDLRLRNRLTQYEGVSGGGLTGKFLSGTTNGFVLADISSIQGVDSYVTSVDWTPNTLTLNRNQGLSALTATIDTFNNLTVTGDLDLQGTLSNSTGDVTIQDNLVVNGNLTITGTTSGIDHNGLDGLQGGTAGEYYHLSKTLYDAATGATNPSNSNPFATIADIAASSGDTNEVKVSTNDSTPGFLENKLTGGTNVTLTTLNDGGNELLQINVNGIDVDDTYVTGGTITTTPSNNSESGVITLSYKSSEGGPYTLPFQDIFLTGGTLSGTDLILTRNDGTSLGAIDLSTLDTIDTFVTGFTWTEGTNTLTISRNQGQSDLNVVVDSFTGPIEVNGDFTVTGGTLTACDILPTTTWNVGGGCDIGAPGSRFRRVYSRSLWLGTSTTTLDDDGSNFQISGNTGDFVFRPAQDFISHANFNPGIDLGYDLGAPAERWNTIYAGDISATGLTISGLGTGRVVYTDGSGGLTTESGFEYNDTTNTITVGNLAVTNASGTTATIGQGGLVIGSGGSPGNNPGIGSLTVHGNLTVYGTETVVDTSNLYVEDNNITINYNPTGDTSSTYQGAGITIQDGDGSNGDIVLATGILYLNGNINSNSEYTAATGASNLGLFTQFNDILIRNTNNTSGSPDGKRVLAEDDVLHGGTY